MNDFYDARMREAYALRDGVVLDPAKFPEVVEVDKGRFRVGSWVFDLVDDGDVDQVLQDLYAWASWYRFLGPKRTQAKRMTGDA
jgi:hypothetical protein